MNGFETKRKINIGMQYLVCCFAAMSDNTEGELSAFVSNCKLVFPLLPQWNKPDILLTCQAAPGMWQNMSSSKSLVENNHLQIYIVILSWSPKIAYPPPSGWCIKFVHLSQGLDRHFEWQTTNLRNTIKKWSLYMRVNFAQWQRRQPTQ